jgi:hypothetical protein
MYIVVQSNNQYLEPVHVEIRYVYIIVFLELKYKTNRQSYLRTGF